MNDEMTVPELVLELRKYAEEEHHGAAHVRRWKSALTAIGDDTGEPAMTLAEAQECYGRFSKRRWGPVVAALGGDLPTRRGTPDDVHRWAYRDRAYGYWSDEPVPGSTGWRASDEDSLPDWYFALPEITPEEATARRCRSFSQCGVYYGQGIYVQNGQAVARRKRSPDEHTHLPMWDEAVAAEYYRGKRIPSYRTTWLDRTGMTRAGWTDTGTIHGVPVARAVICKEDEAECTTVALVDPDLAAAIAARDWVTVRKLAQEKIDER